MYPWNSRMLIEPTHLKLLIEGEEGDVLKARLPASPRHPRALLTLLEGLSLWSGAPMCVVTCVTSRWNPSLVAGLFGEDDLHLESALVRYDFVEVPKRKPRARRLSGVGDFRQLHLLTPGGGR